MAKKTTKYFGDDHCFEMDINYASKNKQLGVVGGLAQLGKINAIALVSNESIIKDVDSSAMRSFHKILK